MNVSTLVVDKIVDSAGVPIIDTSNPVNPIPIVKTALDEVVADQGMMTKAEYERKKTANRAIYGGSGQTESKSGFDNFIYDSYNITQWMFGTKLHPTGIPLINELSMNLDSDVFTNRRENIYFNVDGARIKFDDTSRANRASNTPGIQFAPCPDVTVEPVSTSVRAYKQGEMLIVQDFTRELVPFGNFSAPNANVAPYGDSTVGFNNTITHNSAAGTYTITVNPGNTNISQWLTINNVNMIGGVKYRISLDMVVSGVASATVDFKTWKNGITIDFGNLKNISGTNTYVIEFTPTDSNTALLIGPDIGGTIGSSATFDNLSVQAMEPLKLVCVSDFSGGDILANTAVNIFRKIDSFTRSDFVFMEVWDEDVATNDFVYPLGNVQYGGWAADGVPNIIPGAFTGSDTYSLFGNWQTAGDLVGLGYVWSTLSQADRTKLIRNPNNNIYLDGTTVMQTRYRTRVVNGIGDHWYGLYALDRHTGGDAISGRGGYLRLQGSDHNVIDFGVDNSRLAYLGNNYGNTIGTYGAHRVQAVPIMLVHRRNQGIYHPTYNPDGSAMVLSAGAPQPYYNVSTIATKADCFDHALIAVVDPATPTAANSLANMLASVVDPAVYRRTGSIESTLTARPDGYFYDQIHSSAVEDRRMDATKVTDLKTYAKEEFDKLLSGKARGSEQDVVFEQVGGALTITNVGVYAPYPTYGIHGWACRSIGTYGDNTTIGAGIYSSDSIAYGEFPPKDSQLLIVGDNGNKLWAMGVHHQYISGGNGAAYILLNGADHVSAIAAFDAAFPVGTTITYHTTVYKGYTQTVTKMVCDIIGDPANYPAEWLTHGVFGKPYTVKDDGVTPVTLANYRTSGKGGYIIPLSQNSVASYAYAGSLRVLVTTNGVTTELPEDINWNSIMGNGTTRGYYFERQGSEIRFNLTGTGAYDAALEASTVIQIFYTARSNFTAPDVMRKALAIGDGYVGSRYDNTKSDNLKSMLIDKTTKIRTPVNKDLRFEVDSHNLLPDGTIELSTTGPTLHHQLLPLANDTGLNVKMVPYLNTVSSVAHLNILYKEIKYTSETELLASDAAPSDKYGVAVAISGNRLIVGAYAKDTAAGVDTGKVYAYDWNGTAYIEVATLLASDAAPSDYYGIAVAISGNRLIVGAHGKDTAAGVNAGKVYAYDWNGTAYIEVATVLASDAVAYDYYGIAVAISGNRLIVGAYAKDTVAGVDTGKVYIHTLASGSRAASGIVVGSWGDLNDIPAVNNLAIETDTNGNEVRVGQRSVKLSRFIP